ncbi:hypothetical protein [Pseudomonas sp. LP_7_YM]|uniref:hypothetical protein n=1 Tax=Pseudomonas sp. LP_7_YM TaxID=2485137 RepID=UPI0010F0D1CD|nr:hypothetical protein [Pseudomonas sp. LP_7_YM]TDV72122.1 hypothetical protein EC915_101262 [Pseudomonas sp. LP_7_YM]
MLNGNDEWQQTPGDFLSEAYPLVSRADECLSHLELIRDDRDAIDCLLDTLRQIAGKADVAAVPSIASFARQIRHLLHGASVAGPLLPNTLVCLRQCLCLLSWQVELVDPLTGLLPLDDSEQKELLEHLRCFCAISQMQSNQAGSVVLPVPGPAPHQGFGISR